MKSITIFLLLSFLAVSLHAQCNVNLRYANGVLQWDAIPGVVDYQVQESFDNLQTSRNTIQRSNVFPVNHRASIDTKITYLVTANLGVGVAEVRHVDGCGARTDVTLTADAAFRKLTRKAVIPIAGSTPGAFGGRFKTALTLTGQASGQRGRIIFHPAGQVASNSDPSIAYSFATTSVISYDDVVAAIGASGIGSIDIVPDEDATSIVPTADVRLYNDTALGTFGTLVPVAYPYDYLRAPSLNLTIPDARFRVNVGIRTFTETKVTVLVYGTDQRLRSFHDVTFPADWMQMTTASAFAGTELQPGESLTLHVTGSAVPFYTTTENRTNDPTVVFPGVRQSSTNVGAYVD